MSPSSSINKSKATACNAMNGLTNVRSIQDVNHRPQVLPPNLDDDLQRAAKMVSTGQINDGDTNRGVGATSHSYVILAACLKKQKALEIQHKDQNGLRWRGLFTVALLASLRDSKSHDRSYYDLVRDIGQRMQSLTGNNDGQIPECRGANSFRRVFTHYGVELPKPHEQGKAAAGGRHHK